MKDIIFMFSSTCFVFLIVQINCPGQSNDWENPQKLSHNRMEPHAYFIPYSSEQDGCQQRKSSFTKSLNGIWKFHLANNPTERPKDAFKKNFNVDKWANIKVPANWQIEGFDKFIFTDVEYPIPPDPPFVPKDYNPVGSYKRNFTISPTWKGKEVFIHLGAVNSFFYIWINEHYIGFSKDSKMPAEFNITPYLKRGENSVFLQVFRYSDGTYLEGQDMWKLSGIERDVYLIARPKLAVYDFFVKAGLDERYNDGLFNLKVKLNDQPGSRQMSQSLQIKLFDSKEKLVYEQQAKLQAQKEFQFTHRITEVEKWNAEQPNLYTMVINHLNEKGKLIESISHKIGFRTTEIKNGLFCVNGKAIKIKGVNRHEHDMITAKVVSPGSMVNDIRIMKQFNINAVRNSHYPNSEEWYRLCDKYGIYVIDEANIECDGMSFSPLKTLSDKPEWKDAYLDRTKRMFERDKNFCSIITWSLGNESGFGENFIATYNYLKAKDDTRPVQYEAAGDNPYTDIVCPMYKGPGYLLDYVKEWRTRPLILCEYAHMMGNSGGNLKDYWDLIKRHEQLQGGFIWDFSDQTFKRKDSNGRFIWAYGNDMGDIGPTSDTSFCADGLFSADRQPHPQAYELKKVYQPIQFEAVNFSPATMRIINRFDFTDLNLFSFNWCIKAEGKIIVQGKIDVGDVQPYSSKDIVLNIPVYTMEAGVEYFLTIEARKKNSNELLPGDLIIAWEQFELPGLPKTTLSQLGEFSNLSHVDDSLSFHTYNENFAVIFNKKTGWLQSYTNRQMPLFSEALVPNFWRAVTDNDIGNSQQIRCAVWQTAEKYARLDSFAISYISKKQISVRTIHYLPTVDARYYVIYLIDANGDVSVNILMKAGRKTIAELPRFGMKVILNKNLNKVTWLGRGPFDNYSDRNYAAPIDVYSMPADSLFFPYPRAQESGNRTDVRWISLRSESGFGLMAIGKPTISTGVLHFDMKKLDFNRNAQNNHGESIVNDDFIWWNIDFKQMGVGGVNSWGAKTLSEYMLPYRDYEYSFTLRPIVNNESAIGKSR